jgi:N-acetylmuramoyl-L-alanine amidase
MKIFIDPGHGGEDSGAIGPTGFKEKDFNLQTAKLLEMACIWHGWHTCLSRTQDRNVVERQSAREANEWRADVFVSIHANGATPQANGCETLYWNTGPRSAALAGEVQNQMLARFPWLADRGTKPKFPGDRGATVLRCTHMPAILIEPMFITNHTEEEVLKRFSTQALVADAILESVDLWI